MHIKNHKILNIKIKYTIAKSKCNQNQLFTNSPIFLTHVEASVTPDPNGSGSISNIRERERERERPSIDRSRDGSFFFLQNDGSGRREGGGRSTTASPNHNGNGGGKNTAAFGAAATLVPQARRQGSRMQRIILHP